MKATSQSVLWRVIYWQDFLKPPLRLSRSVNNCYSRLGLARFTRSTKQIQFVKVLWGENGSVSSLMIDMRPSGKRGAFQGGFTVPRLPAGPKPPYMCSHKAAGLRGWRVICWRVTMNEASGPSVETNYLWWAACVTQFQQRAAGFSFNSPKHLQLFSCSPWQRATAIWRRALKRRPLDFKREYYILGPNCSITTAVLQFYNKKTHSTHLWMLIINTCVQDN